MDTGHCLVIGGSNRSEKQSSQNPRGPDPWDAPMYSAAPPAMKSISYSCRLMGIPWNSIDAMLVCAYGPVVCVLQLTYACSYLLLQSHVLLIIYIRRHPLHPHGTMNSAAPSRNRHGWTRPCIPSRSWAKGPRTPLVPTTSAAFVRMNSSQGGMRCSSSSKSTPRLKPYLRARELLAAASNMSPPSTFNIF